MDKIQNWIQLVTSIAVIVGLILVVYELQQARDLAQAQLTMDNYAIQASMLNTMKGESPSKSKATACINPSALTPEDMEVLSAYYQQLLFRTIYINQINKGSGLLDSNWEWIIERNFKIILQTDYGRAWWDTVGRPNYINQIRTIGDRLFDDPKQIPNCMDTINRYEQMIEDKSVDA